MGVPLQAWPIAAVEAGAELTVVDTAPAVTAKLAAAAVDGGGG